MVNIQTLPVVNCHEISAIDAAIIKTTSISHAALMEEAATACVHWLINAYGREREFVILCGAGNNGGDGLVIARRLFMAGYCVRVYAAKGKEGSLQHQQYLRTSRLLPIAELSDDWQCNHGQVVIDALFGVGLQGALRAPYDEYIQRLNALNVTRIAIDMPSGLTDEVSDDQQIVTHADVTLSLCAPKCSQLWACHETYIGDLQVLPLPHAQVVLSNWAHLPQWLTPNWAKAQIRPLQRFAHKGHRGRVAISAGSKGMVGAAILTASACIRSGAGLTTLHLPDALHAAVHAALPEVMLSSNQEPTEQAEILALGPGWGKNTLLDTWLSFSCHARVIDADGLNQLAQQNNTLHHLPPNTILTPHPREFSRLTQKDIPTDKQRIAQAKHHAQLWQVTLVLKGKYSIIATADGRVWVNPTGNNALAKGGSGDVLTGMIAGYLAQGYDSEIATALAVYHHGLAADQIVTKQNAYTVWARDLIAALANSPY